MAFLRSLSLLSLLVLSLCSLSSQRGLGAFGSTRIKNELGPLLSEGCKIIDEASGNMTEATRRWQQFASPNFDAVVQVNNEADIIQTVSTMNIQEKASGRHCARDTNDLNYRSNMRTSIQSHTSPSTLDTERSSR
jgi:hypothetical protein